MSHPVRMTLTRLAFLHAVRAGEVVVDRLGLGRPAYKGLRKVSAQLRELERAGWVSVPSRLPGSGRTVVVELTPAGREILEADPS